MMIRHVVPVETLRKFIFQISHEVVNGCSKILKKERDAILPAKYATFLLKCCQLFLTGMISQNKNGRCKDYAYFGDWGLTIRKGIIFTILVHWYEEQYQSLHFFIKSRIDCYNFIERMVFIFGILV